MKAYGSMKICNFQEGCEMPERIGNLEPCFEEPSMRKAFFLS